MILKGQTAAVSFIHSMKETAIFKMQSLIYLQVPKAENDRSFLQFDKWKSMKRRFPRLFLNMAGIFYVLMITAVPFELKNN
ncbi:MULTISPECIES: hypothetical protein [Cytobacillus]|uniref:Uncharacterized protein n=2 Tax=Cytobacillus oceanisediminis TaxID=665099 RepID=A0A160MCT2_9BACI|nr:MULTISPECIES: hypothetical protein [Cytobacillus]AND40819.1 hypothetical protein A361_17225 [Cytobacillus oceanisediminis 2691]MBU8729538.1 hypothetical protein [Cytobacillus oceanisediminis]MCM3243365.1 hypothetical protein [Cytobacillus oceanisediminis]OHX50871.1 hypothetical protein BBV17_07605 [Cytobacillus oceanisediminis]